MRRRDFIKQSTIALAIPVVTSCDLDKIFPPPTPTDEITTAQVEMAQLAQAVQAQRCELWCWAASISMIFAYHGRRVTQERIVADTYGAVVCLPSMNAFTIGANLSRAYVDDTGRRFVSNVIAGYDPESAFYTISNAMIVDQLNNNGPLLYCNRNHAMVLYAVDYTGSASAPNIVAARVVDPWPPSQRFHALSTTELYPRELGGDMTFLAAVTVS